MSDYIKREDAVKAFENICVPRKATNGIVVLDIDEALSEIELVPSADVVEVVRKPIKGYEGHYEVDQFGRVYSVDRIVHVNDNGREYDKPLKGKRMKQSVHTKGYKTVPLTKDGKTTTHYVHRLVAEAFIPNPSNYLKQVLYFAIQTARAKDFEYANSMRVDVSLSLKELEYLHDCVVHCADMRGE